MAVKAADVRQLKHQLVGWDARWRAIQTLTWFPRGLVAGMGAALILALAARFWPIIPSQQLTTVVGGLAGLGVLAAILAVWLWRRSHAQMARRYDVVFGLRERLSTALELADGRLAEESPALTRHLFDQAISAAKGVHPADGLPFQLDWRWWVGALIMSALVAMAVLIPNPQDAALAQQAEVDQAIAHSIADLEQLKTQARSDPLLPEAEKTAVISALDEAIQTLSQPGVTQEEALAALDATEQKLQDRSAQFAARQQDALQAASGLFSDTAAKDAAEALANGDFAAAAEALKNLDLDNLTDAQKQELAQALGDAAAALEGTNPQLAQQLGEAAEALQNGDTAGAEEALGEAGDQIAQQGQQGQQAGQQPGQQAGQPGQQGQQGQGSGNPVQQYANGVGQSGQGVAKAGKNPKRPDQANQPGQGGVGQAPNFQPGQGGQGQGQQPGQQSGGGSGRGEGDGQPDAPGLSNGQLPTDNGPGDGGEFSFEDIFSPQRVGGEGGEQVGITGNPDAGLPTGAEGDFAANPSGQANVPYNQVYGDYAGVVNQALDSGVIPLGLKDLIKGYFSSLDPNHQ